MAITPHIVAGDLFDQQVEAIVNPWNRNIVPWWLILPHGVSGALKRRAGLEPFHQVAKLGRLQVGQAVLTGAGRLPQRAIIHVASITLWGSSNESIVRACVRSALMLVVRQGFASLAFPLLGTGSGGLSAEIAFAAMVGELAECDYDGEVWIVRHEP